MIIDYASRVDIGTKETNDDRVLIDNTILDMSSCAGTIELPAVVVVCDGCGGYNGGGIAASTVLELLSYESPSMLADTNYLSQVLKNCEQAVNEKKAAMPHYSKMCTTIAGCVFGEDSIVVFHSGDSRVYRYDSWGIARMTKDHSIVQELIDTGDISEEEAYRHPKRNVITRCIGIEGRPPEIYVSQTTINPNEKFVICSDGLWESIKDDEIKEILGSDNSLQEMADVLVNKALEHGADDNISVCICSRQGEKIAFDNKPFVLD